MIRDLPPLPENRKLTRIKRGLVALALGVTVACGPIGPAAADELDDRRDQLDKEIQAQNQAVEGASSEVTKAVQAFEAAKKDLATAEQELATAEEERKAAEELDTQRAKELEAAEVRLEKAIADVDFAKASYDVVDRRTSEEVNVIAQQNGGLMQLSLFVGDVSAADLNQRAQLSDTLFSSSAIELDELTERRFRMESAQQEAEDAEKAAEEARQAAAEQLKVTEQKKQEAETKKAAVAKKVEERDAASKAAEEQLAAEKQRQSELAAESSDLDRRIQERIAEQKRLEQERIAREKAEAERRAEAERNKATNSRPTDSGGSSNGGGGGSGSTSYSSGSGFIRPVSGSLSSPYGMRLHPVLGYWKLHDGTDFAAPCGAELRAPADGTVVEKYFNAGYGNRLMIDHGKVNGDYVTTGYNHATHYVVSVGQHVSKGQVVGYVGSTGYSTGCHLHLMVWENGNRVDPMARWFD
ncbi:M23 family metallopeptidase [Arachnia propionica]|uniref:M23ase beta-sheet core domain-containing protein n=1 Tax=Arachnia propionica TaxID=1750 RepID=A0A3P1X2W6_9ACTN|nr:M23 family metallopeptidase [Arachnia propionica]RRD51093.1 hypothetical protein EII35_01435 [Arachnia propionica]